MRPVWNPRRRRKDRGSARFRGKSPWLAALWVPCYFAPVASPPGAGGSRYAGRVVDPDVRDDGETEPEVELNPSPTSAGVRESGEVESSHEAVALVVAEGAAPPSDGADQPAAEMPSRPETS